ncbi:uncharacterized protein ACHE_51286S [Aspergillus chevalieri]|uniref:Uncharacterized protein n=1 Tax=Aspergillus chevalieri TaxID=182096 RepID=A0A7R7VSP2_ASPCH|nr:uncharacterized protein ACHE_51286S [Aspergillus chevalieri]BCR90088.1 hypothetical protein ACHE_51286S [Aspergillus chevalieri]
MDHYDPSLQKAIHEVRPSDPVSQICLIWTDILQYYFPQPIKQTAMTDLPELFPDMGLVLGLIALTIDISSGPLRGAPFFHVHVRDPPHSDLALGWDEAEKEIKCELNGLEIKSGMTVIYAAVVIGPYVRFYTYAGQSLKIIHWTERQTLHMVHDHNDIVGHFDVMKSIFHGL